MRIPLRLPARPAYQSNMDGNPCWSSIGQERGFTEFTLTASRRGNWLAVFAIALAMFAFTTSELLPVGLLIPISADLHVSLGTAGLCIVFYGLGAGVLTPVLAATTRQVDRRTVLAGILTTFTAGNLCSALATSVSLLMIARLMTGLAHGLLSFVAAGIAVRLVPEQAAVKAMASVFSGVTVAFVAGLPLGTLAGTLTHWRAVFDIMAALGTACLGAVVLLLPALAPASGFSLAELRRLLRNPHLRAGLLVTTLVVAGHFSAFAYLSPYLTEVANIGPRWLSVVLLVFGLASAIGNFVAGACASRALRATLIVAMTGVTAAVLLLLAIDTYAAVVMLVIAWGLTFPALPLCLQTLVLRSARTAPEAATLAFTCSFNVTLALGALGGGWVLDRYGPPAALLLGGVLCIGATAVLAAARAQPDG